MTFIVKKFTNLENDSKNNYKLETIQQNVYKTWLNLIIIIICLATIALPILSIKNRYQINSHIIYLGNNLTVSHTVSDKFLSIGLDSSLLRDMNHLPINNKKFINFAHYLKPAHVRIGGTAADCLYFEQIFKEKVAQKKSYLEVNTLNTNDISNFTITGDDFLSLYKFSKMAGLELLFDLNTLFRNHDGSWNSTNAKEIILFAKAHDMELAWQMGNEPNSFHHVFNVSVPAEQLAKDYCILRKILNQSGYQKSILVGPEANHIGDERNSGAIYVENFLKHINDCIDFVTWHQYYLNGHIAKAEDFINPSVFDRLSIQIEMIKNAVEESGQNIPIWISETSSAFGGGAPNLSDRFLAGFLWLDKLGYSAKVGVQVVIRQTLFGGNYAMIGTDLEPNPDWWVSVLFKKFVSNKVLELVFPRNSHSIRLYAHCALRDSSLSEISQVVIYGMNLNNFETKVYLKGLSKKTKIFSYTLTSDHLQSRNILLNGNILKLQNNGSLPILHPKTLNINQAIVLPPYSMVFLLLSDIGIQIC